MSKAEKKIIKESSEIEKKPWAEFKNIEVFINQEKILGSLSKTFEYGENIVILGPNGSGKTTFLKLINRSIYPKVSNNSSLKLFKSENINIWDLRKKIGFLFKEMEERVNKNVKTFDLIASGFTGLYNSRESHLLTSTELNRVEGLIMELGLSTFINRKFYTLSDGQKRISLLARALVYRPRLIVLDEPFSNLDIKSNYFLVKILNKLMVESTNIIYVTHSLDSILPRTNRVLLFKNGKIIDDGNPDDIITSEVISDLYDTSIYVLKHKNYWRTIPLTD